MQAILSKYPNYVPPNHHDTGQILKLRVPSLYAANLSIKVKAFDLTIEPGATIAAPKASIIARNLFFGLEIQNHSAPATLFGEDLQVLASHLLIGKGAQIFPGSKGSIHCNRATFIVREDEKLSPSQKLIEKLLNHDAKVSRASSVEQALQGDTV